MDNVDDLDTKHFEEMATKWWDPQGPCRPLHDLNLTRLQFITDRCDLKQKKVLDIGCGGGILSESLAKRGAFVTGIDAGQKLIQTAIQHANNAFSNLIYLHTTAEEFAKTEYRSFDVITCLELIEHVPNPSSLISACATLIKPQGHLFFSTLNRNPKAYLMAILGAEYVLNLLPKGTHRYENFIKPSELDQSLRNAGLQLKELTGLSYNPFSRRARLCRDISVNYLAYAQPSNPGELDGNLI